MQLKILAVNIIVATAVCSLSVTRLQAQVYSTPSEFGWRKSIPLHLIKVDKFVVDLGINAEVTKKLRDLQAEIETECDAEILKTIKGGTYTSKKDLPFRESLEWNRQRLRMASGAIEKLHEIRNRHTQELESLLTVEQQSRLHQIYLWNLEIGGQKCLTVDALSDPGVAKELQLSELQIIQIKSVHNKIERSQAYFEKGVKRDGPPYSQLARERVEKIMSILTAEQRAAFEKLLGSPVTAKANVSDAPRGQ